MKKLEIFYQVRRIFYFRKYIKITQEFKEVF